VIARTHADFGAIALSERQTQIVDTAMRIIATAGARRFTVQTLASEVGVTGGAIYRHFESMAAIGDAIVERVGQLLFDGFPPDAADAIERLSLFFHHRAQTIRNNPHVSQLLFSDNLSQACGAEYAERLQEFKRRTQRFVVSSLAEAAQNGTLSAELTPEVGAIVLMGAIQALSHYGTRPVTMKRPQPLETQVWSAIERLLRGSTISGQPAEQPRTRAQREP
jgi:AcrR family transcriptional regulator